MNVISELTMLQIMWLWGTGLLNLSSTYHYETPRAVDRYIQNIKQIFMNCDQSRRKNVYCDIINGNHVSRDYKDCD